MFSQFLINTNTDIQGMNLSWQFSAVVSLVYISLAEATLVGKPQNCMNLWIRLVCYNPQQSVELQPTTDFIIDYSAICILDLSIHFFPFWSVKFLVVAVVHQQFLSTNNTL